MIQPTADGWQIAFHPLSLSFFCSLSLSLSLSQPLLGLYSHFFCYEETCPPFFHSFCPRVCVSVYSMFTFTGPLLSGSTLIHSICLIRHTDSLEFRVESEIRCKGREGCESINVAAATCICICVCVWVCVCVCMCAHPRCIHF